MTIYKRGPTFYKITQERIKLSNFMPLITPSRATVTGNDSMNFASS